MSDKYITLMGAEQVQSAASTISSAADTMRRAASEIEYSLTRHQQWLDSWLAQFAATLEQHREETRPIVHKRTIEIEVNK